MIDPPEKFKTGGAIYWVLIGVGVVLTGVVGLLALASRHRHASDVEINLMFAAGLMAVVTFLMARRRRDSGE
jgi:hypothetical protein